MSVPVLPEPAPPTGDRFAVVTPDDNAAPLIIVTILSLVFSFFVFGIRILVVKWRRSSVDDWTLALAHVSCHRPVPRSIENRLLTEVRGRSLQ
jgi:hypothetical protein